MCNQCSMNKIIAEEKESMVNETLHPSHGFPGNLVTECENCDILHNKIKEYEKAFEALESLAAWYEGANSVIGAYRVRNAMNGIPPVQKRDNN